MHPSYFSDTFCFYCFSVLFLVFCVCVLVSVGVYVHEIILLLEPKAH